ncbi:hypothetical protein A4G18_05425 [Pasteurellaceae bacterium Pebbles2]|nr:hypothetical protein [Pasteurellaceae bacterium Pebbles2]
MKKLATIGAIALLALSVTACEKADPVADYKKYDEWYQTQAPIQTAAQAEFNQQLADAMSSNDSKKLEAAFQNFAGKVQETLKSLDAVNVKSDEIKALKEKAKGLLNLSNEVLTEQAKLVAEPNAEKQQAVQAKADKVKEYAGELEKLQAELQGKFSK